MSLTTVHATYSTKWSEVDQRWSAIEGFGSACVELRPKTNRRLSGWVLLKANFRQENNDYTNKLSIRTKSGTVEFGVSVKSDGTISELFYLPNDVIGIYLQVAGYAGCFSLQDVRVKPVAMGERLIRMWARVGAMFRTHSRARRKNVGIRFYTPFFHLTRAYRVLSRLRSYSAELPYSDWIEEFDQLSQRDIKRITTIITSWKNPPEITVLVVVKSSSYLENLQQTINSLSSQLYPNYKIILLLPDVSDARSVASMAFDNVVAITPEHRSEWVAKFNSGTTSRDTDDLLLTIRPGTVLPVHSLYWFVSEFIAKQSTNVVYADHDYLDAQQKRYRPIFKPDWSPEYLRSTHYFGDTVALRTRYVLALGGLLIDDAGLLNLYDLHLRCTECASADSIRHIPTILSHCLNVEQSLHNDTAESNHNRLNVSAHLQRLNIAASITTSEHGHNRLQYSLPDQLPKISIIIPTRDMLEFVKPCVDSILSQSSYPDYEIIIVDNESIEPATLQYFQQFSDVSNVRVLAFKQAFNFSMMNNFAIEHARGEIVCLLNNDTKVITPAWMEEMVGPLLQKNIGVVGAKLYFSDDRIQHIGVAVGPGGCASHLHSRLPRYEAGYCGRAVVSLNVAAVTAACLMTHKSLYKSLNGLNEKDLAVEFNDIDYCLRVRKAGYEVIYTPHAELYHYESISRAKDFTSEEKKQARRREADHFRRSWPEVIKHDPFYNPNLTRVRADFTRSHAPLVEKPWNRPCY